jgi:phage terminase small subunit
MTTSTPKKGTAAIPDAWQERFITHLARHGNASAAAKHAGVSRNFAYQHKREDTTFAAAWADAIEQYIELLETEADRRAVKGLRRLKFYQGDVIKDDKGKAYEEREYSDTLLMFRLKALAPDKYRERTETKHTYDPVDWDLVPPDIRDAFIEGKVSLADVHRLITSRTA